MAGSSERGSAPHMSRSVPPPFDSPCELANAADGVVQDELELAADASNATPAPRASSESLGPGPIARW